jgi:DUF1680 family protein
MQVPYYNVHKIMAGLLDQHQLLHNSLAFEVLLKMASYFRKRITTLIQTNGTAVWEQVLETETGGMNDVMYKVYAITHDTRHLEMAHLFDKQSWFGPLFNSTDMLGGHHANTHLALTVGGANRFGVIGAQAEEYKRATEFFVRTLRSAHSYTTGGSNYREYWQAAHSQGSSLFIPPSSSSSAAAALEHGVGGGSFGACAACCILLPLTCSLHVEKPGWDCFLLFVHAPGRCRHTKLRQSVGAPMAVVCH